MLLFFLFLFFCLLLFFLAPCFIPPPGAPVLGAALCAASVSLARRSTRASGASATARQAVLTLGTRGSPLALAQAYEAKKRLGEAFEELAGDDAVEIRIISTTGDQRLEISLAEIGGKGLFTRELDVALASKEVDFCVHSTKDVPTDLIPDTELCTMLPREDTRDVLISGDEAIKSIEDFPDGSLIGTASLRRQVKCVNFRGNVQTRLRKLQGGDVKGTFLAYAGLKRMSMEEHATKVLEWEEMLPAIAQGAISFQCRSDDDRVLNYLKPLSHDDTFQAVTCERAFLAALDGNCKTPIAGRGFFLALEAANFSFGSRAEIQFDRSLDLLKGTPIPYLHNYPPTSYFWNPPEVMLYIWSFQALSACFAQNGPICQTTSAD
ncbi:unnamed protein product [Effrenium voratum]|nr:unnamed protein product [Effrenium voratum]